MEKKDILHYLERILDGSYTPFPDLEGIEDSEGEDDIESRRITRVLNELYHRKEREQNIFQKELAESEERLKKIIESTPLGICITNKEGIYEYVNPNYCRLYGYEKEEILGRHFTTVVPESKREELIKLHEDFMGRSYELRGEWEVVRKDGKFLTILADAAYIIDVDGKPKKVTFVLDITERKKLEQIRENVERMIRHDLKNPLNGIIGSAEVLLTEDLSEEHREFVGMIRDAAWKLNHMLSAGTDFIRMEQGTYDFQPVSLNIVRLLEEVGREVSRPREERIVTIEYKCNGLPLKQEEALPCYNVPGEKTYLGNLFSNLLFNAVEASGPGDRVTVNIVTGPPEEKSYSVEIHNSRPVPESIRNNFFEKYVTKEKKNGTGLGTYIARLITHVHGGDISFTTSEESGTTVRVTLPRE